MNHGNDIHRLRWQAGGNESSEQRWRPIGPGRDASRIAGNNLFFEDSTGMFYERGALFRKERLDIAAATGRGWKIAQVGEKCVTLLLKNSAEAGKASISDPMEFLRH